MNLFKAGPQGCVRHLCTAVMLLVLAPAALAQVTLTNSVKKVETFVDDAGVPQRRLVDVSSVVPGDELRYTITFTNEGTESVDAGSIVITNPIPEDTEYLDGTAFGSGTEITFSTDAGERFADPDELSLARGGTTVPAMARDYTTIRWVFAPPLKPGETSFVSFNVRLK